MKRVTLILLAVSTMAGIAGAQMMKPTPVASAPMPAKNEYSPQARQDPVKQEVAPARIPATLVATRAPVPMQLAPRIPIATRETSEADKARPEANRLETAPTEAAEGLSDSSVRAAIEADGYKRVKVLSKSENGTWRALALRGKTEVALRVDAQGNVMAD
jgi:hypothetical protein